MIATILTRPVRGKKAKRTEMKASFFSDETSTSLSPPSAHDYPAASDASFRASLRNMLFLFMRFLAPDKVREACMHMTCWWHAIDRRLCIRVKIWVDGYRWMCMDNVNRLGNWHEARHRMLFYHQ